MTSTASSVVCSGCGQMHASFPGPGRYSILVSGIRFPRNETLDGAFEATRHNEGRDLDMIVSNQAIGTWLLQAAEQRVTFRTRVTIRTTTNNTDEVTETVEWQNRDGEFDHIFNRPAGMDVVLRFRVDVTRFADPLPNERDGDSDRDGITEFEEASLGLCHPTESTNDCPSGSIPQSERDPGVSVMGTPAEDENLFVEIENALARPLDYSTTQWSNVQLFEVRPTP